MIQAIGMISASNPVGHRGQDVMIFHWPELFRRTSRFLAPQTLGDAIDALLHAKQKANRRPRYVNALRQYLRMFARGREDTPIRSLTVHDLEDWFASRDEKPSTQAGSVTRLSALFSFAVRRGWIQDNPCRRLEPIREDQRIPEILDIRTAAKCLVWAKRRQPRFMGWLALALMAGVRPEEADKVRWGDVALDRGTVRIDAAASKVRRRRIVHLMPAAVAWLRVAHDLGADLPLGYNARRRCLRRLRQHLGWKRWPQDILRHTAASYWLAEWQDAGRVAHELGNSAGILLRRYRELVERDEAKRFWGLVPRERNGNERG